MAAPPPNGTRKRTPLPLILVALAVVLAVIVYVATRSSPNFEGEGVEQPAPVETST